MNQLTIVGYIKKEPTHEQTKNGIDVLSFSVFVRNPRMKDKVTTEGYPVGDWFAIKVWGKYAVSLANVLKKGDQVLVQGEYISNKNEDKVYWTLHATKVMKLYGGRPTEAQREPVLSADEAPDPVDVYDPFAE